MSAFIWMRSLSCCGNHSYEADAASTTSKDSTAPLRSRLTDKEHMNRAKFSTQQHPNHTDRHKTQHRREPSVISQASLAFLSITKSFIKARSRSRVLLHNISRRAQQLPGPWGVVQARKEAARKLTERRRAEEEERDSLQHNPSNTSLATRCPTFATVVPPARHPHPTPSQSSPPPPISRSSPPPPPLSRPSPPPRGSQRVPPTALNIVAFDQPHHPDATPPPSPTPAGGKPPSPPSPAYHPGSSPSLLLDAGPNLIEPPPTPGFTLPQLPRGGPAAAFSPAPTPALCPTAPGHRAGLHRGLGHLPPALPSSPSLSTHPPCRPQCLTHTADQADPWAPLPPGLRHTPPGIPLSSSPHSSSSPQAPPLATPPPLPPHAHQLTQVPGAGIEADEGAPLLPSTPPQGQEDWPAPAAPDSSSRSSRTFPVTHSYHDLPSPTSPPGSLGSTMQPLHPTATPASPEAAGPEVGGSIPTQPLPEPHFCWQQLGATHPTLDLGHQGHSSMAGRCPSLPATLSDCITAPVLQLLQQQQPVGLPPAHPVSPSPPPQPPSAPFTTLPQASSLNSGRGSEPAASHHPLPPAAPPPPSPPGCAAPLSSRSSSPLTRPGSAWLTWMGPSCNTTGKALSAAGSACPTLPHILPLALGQEGLGPLSPTTSSTHHASHIGSPLPSQDWTDHASPPLLPTSSGLPHHSTSAPPTHRSLCPPPSQPAPPPLHPLYPTPSLNPHTPSPGATNPGCSQNTAHPLIRPRTAHPPPQRLSSTSQLSPPPDTLLPRGPPMTAAGREEGEGLLLRRSSSLNHLDPPLSWVAPGQLQPPSPSSATPAAGLPAPVRSHLGRAVGSAPGYVLLPQLQPLAVEAPGERGRGGVASNLAATPCQLGASPGTGLTPRPPHPSSARPAGVQPAPTMTLGLPPGLVWAPEALRGPAAPLAAVLPPGPPLCRPLRAAFAPSPAHSPSSAHSPDPFTPRTRGLAEVSQARRKPPLRPSTSNRVSPSQQPNHWRQGLLTAIASSNISAESSSGVLGSSVIARPDELVSAGLQGRLHAHTMQANPVRSLPGSHRTTRNGSIAIWGAGFPEQHTAEHDPVAAAQAWVQTSGQRAAVEEVPRTYNRVCSSGWSERKSAQRHGENERLSVPGALGERPISAVQRMARALSRR